MILLPPEAEPQKVEPLRALTDESLEKKGWHRTHVIDACQLLGLDRSYKYTQGSIENLAALANACRNKAVARTRLFEWLIFNVLVGNTDAHLKNLSFTVSDNEIQLAPFYDLLCIAAYESLAFDQRGWPDQTQLAWPILGVRRFSDINRQLLLESGVALGLAQATSQRLIENLSSRIIQASELLYAEYEEENTKTLKIVDKVPTTMAGESRCLRTILHTVIKQMVKQIT